MTSFRTVTFVAWSLTLSFLVLKVNSNNSGNVQLQCPENKLCKNTSGCSQSYHRHTVSNPRHSQMLPIRHSLQHYRGLVREFQIVLLTYIETVLNVSKAWEDEDVRVSVLERGLRNLYPLSNQTELYTSAGPEDEHQILRESRWLLTSVEAHVQLLHAVNYTRTDVFHSLEGIAQHRSVSFAHLLTQFHVTGLPAQATCVRTTVARTSSQINNREQFTNMALRDIHQALVRISLALGSCEVQWLDEHRRRPKLNCTEASVFYSTMPQGLNFFYNYSEVLAFNNASRT